MAPNRWDQIKKIFRKAQDRLQDDRDEYLAEACGDDTDLRCEVESLLPLLEQVGRTEDYIPESAEEPPPTIEQTSSGVRDDPRIGQWLGH